ncbi:hypothetical protein, partial [Alistipes putredinis]|uniref:hypothetical protein n=1 Tax=Alistipes putredinis TaxID=28117 RepID=UPI003A95089A
IRQPAAQSKLRELRQRARSACFVPVMQKMQNNRNFTLSRKLCVNCVYDQKQTSHLQRCKWLVFSVTPTGLKPVTF